jgi:hypothetical protein
LANICWTDFWNEVKYVAERGQDILDVIDCNGGKMSLETSNTATYNEPLRMFPPNISTMESKGPYFRAGPEQSFDALTLRLVRSSVKYFGGFGWYGEGFGLELLYIFVDIAKLFGFDWGLTYQLYVTRE